MTQKNKLSLDRQMACTEELQLCGARKNFSRSLAFKTELSIWFEEIFEKEKYF